LGGGGERSSNNFYSNAAKSYLKERTNPSITSVIEKKKISEIYETGFFLLFSFATPSQLFWGYRGWERAELRATFATRSGFELIMPPQIGNGPIENSPSHSGFNPPNFTAPDNGLCLFILWEGWIHISVKGVAWSMDPALKRGQEMEFYI